MEFYKVLERMQIFWLDLQSLVSACDIKICNVYLLDHCDTNSDCKALGPVVRRPFSLNGG